MTTYTWPNTRAFVPNTAQLQVIDNLQRVSESPLSGATQTLSMPGARWGWQYDFGAQETAHRQQLEAYLLRLNGREHRVRLWDALHPQPAGAITLSGVVVANTASQFATELTLGNCLHPRNLLAGGGFEIDSNGDGVADGWVLYTAGTVGVVAKSLQTGPMYPGATGKFQALTASTLNGRLGVGRSLPVIAGQPYAWAIDAHGTAGMSLYVTINWLDSAGTYISESTWIGSSAPARRSIVGTAPAGAATASIYVWLDASSGAAAELHIDQAQFERSPAPTPYAGPATLLAGDWLGLASGQIVRVVANATANDIGYMAVEVRHMLRQQASAGSAVTLDTPTALFIRSEAGLVMPRNAGLAMAPMSVAWTEVFA